MKITRCTQLAYDPGCLFDASQYVIYDPGI